MVIKCECGKVFHTIEGVIEHFRIEHSREFFQAPSMRLLKGVIEWILEELLPDYDNQVNHAGIGTGISLEELDRYESIMRDFLSDKRKKENNPSRRNTIL